MQKSITALALFVIASLLTACGGNKDDENNPNNPSSKLSLNYEIVQLTKYLAERDTELASERAEDKKLRSLAFTCSDLSEMRLALYEIYKQK